MLTALRMGMLPDDAGPACGVPGMLRLDRGLEFAAESVRAAAAALGTEVHVLPPYQANRKGKIERTNPRPLRLTDIDADGSRLLTEHGPVPIPACAHPILRAHRHLLDPAGTAPDTALFTGERATQAQLAAQALQPLKLTRSPGPRYRRSQAYLRGHATDWMQHRGLELCALAELRPRPDYP